MVARHLDRDLCLVAVAAVNSLCGVISGPHAVEQVDKCGQYVIEGRHIVIDEREASDPVLRTCKFLQR